MHHCEGQWDEEVGEGEVGIGGLAVVEGYDGDKAVPEHKSFVDLELSEEETIEPLDAGDL